MEVTGSSGSELGGGSAQVVTTFYDLHSQFNSYRLYAYISLRPTATDPADIVYEKPAQTERNVRPGEKPIQIDQRAM